MATPFSQTSHIALGLFISLLLISLMMGVIINKVDYLIIFGIIGGIFVFILSFVNVQFAVYILIFATLLSPEFGSRSTSGSGVTVRVDDFILILICFAQLTKSALYERVGLFSWTPLNRYINAYILICLVSTITGALFGRGSPISGFFFTAKYYQYFVIYFMVINNLDSKKQARGYLVAILITATIVSFVAMSQIPGGGRVSAPFEGESGEPNTLGGYLVLMTSLVGGLLLTPKAVEKYTLQMMLYGLMGIMFIIILFTLSRATWLSAVPVAIMFWIFSRQKIMFTAVAVGGMALAPLLMPDTVVERLLYTTEKQQNKWALAQQEQIGGMTFDTSSSARIKSWKNAVEAIPAHPIIGWGVNGWRFIDAQYFKVIVETGILGFTAFILLLYNILKQSWRMYRTGKDPLFKGVALGMFIGTIAMICHATVTNTFIIVRIMEPFCLILAIVIGIPQLEEAEKLEEEKKEQEAEAEPTKNWRQLAKERV
ncbi:MAG: O-antigen ligase family protein [Candidatus Latescibacteria bacterium]|jgi:O-antigen ligase|nr:O-antigen ligase family protein [Candidatus Latescibacterota bacterium]MBT4138116.1 O-antigen ligase family protein [Candidatus Latescibacterota bacterium]